MHILQLLLHATPKADICEGFSKTDSSAEKQTLNNNCCQWAVKNPTANNDYTFLPGDFAGYTLLELFNLEQNNVFAEMTPEPHMASEVSQVKKLSKDPLQLLTIQLPNLIAMLNGLIKDAVNNQSRQEIMAVLLEQLNLTPGQIEQILSLGETSSKEGYLQQSPYANVGGQYNTKGMHETRFQPVTTGETFHGQNDSPAGFNHAPANKDAAVANTNIAELSVDKPLKSLSNTGQEKPVFINLFANFTGTGTTENDARVHRIQTAVYDQTVNQANAAIDTARTATEADEMPAAAKVVNQMDEPLNLVRLVNSTEESPVTAKVLPQADTSTTTTKMVTLADVVSATAKGVDTTSSGMRNVEPPVLMQLVEGIKAHSNADGQGRTHIRLQLQPESLGEVVVRLIYKEGTLSTHFHAATESAKQIIESSLIQLREVLATNQLNLQQATVSSGGEEGRWGQDWNQGRQFGGTFHQGGHEHDETKKTASATGPETTQPDNLKTVNHFV